MTVTQILSAADDQGRFEAIRVEPDKGENGHFLRTRRPPSSRPKKAPPTPIEWAMIAAFSVLPLIIGQLGIYTIARSRRTV
jgi:hypothetical protein